MTLNEYLAEYRRMTEAGYYSDLSPNEMGTLLRIIEVQDATIREITPWFGLASDQPIGNLLWTERHWTQANNCRVYLEERQRRIAALLKEKE